MKLAGKLPEKLPEWAKDHAKRYLDTGGKDGHYYKIPGQPNDIPTLLLATKGRKSGEALIFPLIYGVDGKSHVIVASKGGAPDHPVWYKNLVAEPKAQIQVGDKVLNVRARTVTGPDRKRLWDALAKIWPPYNDYQKTAGAREIPVVALDPA